MKSFPLNIKISAGMSNVMKTFSKLERGLQNVSKAATNIGQNLTFKASVPLAAFAGLAIKTSAEFEKMGVSMLTAFEGNEAAARAAQTTITDFAARTPFQLDEVMESFIRLKNMGLDPSEEALISYGNTAGAMGTSLSQMIEAVADATVGEFERLKAYNIKASSEGNKVAFTFRGQTTVVRKSAEEIEKYLLKIGNTDFAGGMEMQSKTLLGVVSTLQGSVQQAFGKIGDSIRNVTGLTGRIEGLTKFIDRMATAFTNLSPFTKEFLVWGGLAVAALGPVLMVFGNLGFAIVGITAAVTALAPVLTGLGVILATLAANPITLTIAVLGGLAVAMYQLMPAAESVGQAIKAVFLGLGSYIFTYAVEPMQRALAYILDSLEAIGVAAPKSLRGLAEFDYNTFADRALASNVSLSPQSSRARVDVNFANAPTGMRVNQQTFGTLEMQTNVGHQLRVP